MLKRLDDLYHSLEKRKHNDCGHFLCRRRCRKMKKTKRALTAIALAILSLMIIAYLAELQTLPSSPHNRPVSEVVEVGLTSFIWLSRDEFSR